MNDQAFPTVYLILYIILNCLSSAILILGYQKLFRILFFSAHIANVTFLVFVIFLIKRVPGISLGETFWLLSVVLSISGIYFVKKNVYDKTIIAISIFSSLALFICSQYINDYSIYNEPPEVLDNNFWIIVHVLSIISGYGCILMASLFSHTLIIKHLINENMKLSSEKKLKVITNLTKNGMLLIIIGTFLGSLWAKVAWGRFWAWDPKETAVLIVILTLVISYLLSTILKPLNFFKLYTPILGFITIIYAWIGVNFISQNSIHAYGLTENGMLLIVIFTLLELVFFLFHPVSKLLHKYL